MAFDGVVMAALKGELQKEITGARVVKIAMPNKDELLFTLKRGPESLRLVISAAASLPLLYLGSENKQSPPVAPAFCMLLRKHIGSAVISKVSQQGLERIICIEFDHFNELGDPDKKRLYIELMGKHSNIIFTDENDLILDSIKRISAQVSSLREVLPGRTYALPENLRKNDLFALEESTLFDWLSGRDQTVHSALYKEIAGISPLMADRLCMVSDIGTETAISDLDDEARYRLYLSLLDLLNKIKREEFFPNIVWKGDTPVAFSCLPLPAFSEPDYRVEPFDSVSRLLFEFYHKKDRSLRMKQKSADLRRIVTTALERNMKKFDLQSKQLVDTEKKEQFKLYGDLIRTYGFSLPEGAKVLVCDGFEEGSQYKIPLESDLSVPENATRYYDRYAKLKRTKEALAPQLEKTQAEIRHLQSILEAVDLADCSEDLQQIQEELTQFGYLKKDKRKKTGKIISKPLVFTSSEGLLIYVGKNNYQNEEITFHLASPDDWWFHAKGVPGSHVVVKSEKGQMEDKTFEEAAALAALYSKSKEGGKVEVDYIQRKHLKRVQGAPPGFVIYHNNWSLMADTSLAPKPPWQA